MKLKRLNLYFILFCCCCCCGGRSGRFSLLIRKFLSFVLIIHTHDTNKESQICLIYKFICLVVVVVDDDDDDDDVISFALLVIQIK